VSDALIKLDVSLPTESTPKPPRNPKKQLTKEERKKREQLLARYSYDLDEVVENEYGEAEISYKDRSETKEINSGKYFIFYIIKLFTSINNFINFT
jgi:hypothetical protein